MEQDNDRTFIEVVTLKTVAEALGIQPVTVCNYSSQGVLPRLFRLKDGTRVMKLSDFLNVKRDRARQKYRIPENVDVRIVGNRDEDIDEEWSIS